MQSFFLSDITTEKAIWERRKSSFLSLWLKPSCNSRNAFSVFLIFQVRTCYLLKIQMQVIGLTWNCKIVIILAESDLTRSSSPTGFSKQHQATPSCSELCPVKFWVSPNVIPLETAPLGHLCQYFTTCGMIFFFFPDTLSGLACCSMSFSWFCAALRRKSSLYLSLQVVVVNCSSNFPFNKSQPFLICWVLQPPDHIGCPPLGSPLYIPNWRYYCRCDLPRLWAKGSAADLLVMLLLTDPSMWPSLFVEMAHCWLTLNLISTVSPQSFPAMLLSIQLTTQPILGLWNDCVPDAALCLFLKFMVFVSSYLQPAVFLPNNASTLQLNCSL